MRGVPESWHNLLCYRRGVCCDLTSKDRDAGRVDWDTVCWAAAKRGDEQCFICLMPLMRNGANNVAWMSCSHTCHVQCLETFEAYEELRGGQATCPLCRAQYTRVTL